MSRHNEPSMQSLYQQLREHLTALKLEAILDALPSALDEAAAHNLSVTQTLEQLMRVEREAAVARKLAGRFRFANIPQGLTLDTFDIDYASGIDKQLLQELGTCRFIETATNVLLIGPPGAGKTHIAAGLGHAAVNAGYRVYFTTAADLAARCHRAAIEGKWATMMRFFAGPSLLIVDELGYLPLPGEAASALFQVINQRYLKTSMILTTNRPVGAWGEILGDTTVAAAMLDRLLHRSVVVTLDGPSYRLRQHNDQAEELRRATTGTIMR